MHCFHPLQIPQFAADSTVSSALHCDPNTGTPDPGMSLLSGESDRSHYKCAQSSLSCPSHPSPPPWYQPCPRENPEQPTIPITDSFINNQTHPPEEKPATDTSTATTLPLRLARMVSSIGREYGHTCVPHGMARAETRRQSKVRQGCILESQGVSGLERFRRRGASVVRRLWWVMMKVKRREDEEAQKQTESAVRSNDRCTMDVIKYRHKS